MEIQYFLASFLYFLSNPLIDSSVAASVP